MSRAELKEKKKENEAIAEIKSRNMWKMWTRLFKNEDNMMGNAAFYGGVTAAGLIVIYKVAKVAAQHAQTQLAKPKLSKLIENALDVSVVFITFRAHILTIKFTLWNPKMYSSIS